MEDILDLYHQPYDPKRPMVGMDETSKQLIGETRSRIGAQVGRVERYDYEYERNGVSNIFMFFDPLGGWRHVKVTDQRTKVDWAQCMQELVDILFAHRVAKGHIPTLRSIRNYFHRDHKSFNSHKKWRARGVSLGM